MRMPHAFLFSGRRWRSFCAHKLFLIGYTEWVAGELTQLRRARYRNRAAMLMSSPAHDAYKDGMGLFDFLKKKGDTPQADAETVAHARPERPSAAGPVTRIVVDKETKEAERERQREIARATAAKIDEIELEMASAIFDDDAWGGSRRPPAAVAGGTGTTVTDENTDILLGPEDLPDAVATPSSAPVVEEAAILYANDQLDAAALALDACLHDRPPTSDGSMSERLPWWMLFDLYQIMGRETAFESVAIDYASRFETSPPTYNPFSDTARARAGSSLGDQYAGAIPTASLTGRLDDTPQIRAQLARVQAPSPLVRLEFQGIVDVTAPGCALLLDTLQALRKAGRELVLAGADHLVAVLRPMLAIGEPGAGEAPWLLLLELLLLTNREKDFEETAMDYCVTFEVSPPSFEAPQHAAAAVNQAADPATAGDRFLLPAVMRGEGTGLLAAIAAHAERHPALVLDCSRLARIDYAAANALATHLRTLAVDGREVVLRDLNHLAAALLRLLGVGDQVRLYTHKY